MTAIPPATPPVPALLDAGPSSWPGVIGTISIVWASLGLICNGCGTVKNAVPGLLSGLGPAGQQAATNAAGSPVLLGLSIVGFLWSLLLLAGGIKLVSRKSSARGLHLAWVAGAIPMGLIGTYFGYVIGKQQAAANLQQMQSDPKTAEMAQKMAPYMDYFMLGGVACGVFVGLAWPVFCLIWFGAVKRNSAEIAAGTEEMVA